jgi:CDP-diglyceride synthetase
MTVLKILLLLAIANGAPILARGLLGERLSYPIDGGRCFIDGRPLFGVSKTWRGLLAAILMTAVAADLLQISFVFGALFGALAMLGDLMTSFMKRRLGLKPSSKATGLDQILESLLPAAVAAFYLEGITLIHVVFIVALFFFLEVTLSPLLFKFGIRRRPY